MDSKRVGKEQSLRVGIEWEPQITLLKYPCKAIYVYSMHFSTSIYATRSYECRTPGERAGMQLVLDESQLRKITSDRVYIDDGVANLEVATKPVEIQDLAEEIEKCAKSLQKVSEYIATVTQSQVGVFLPVSTSHLLDLHVIPLLKPAKHINIDIPLESLHSLPDEERAFFARKAGVYGRRLHVPVPYNFTEYADLLEEVRKVYREMKSELAIVEYVSDFVEAYSMKKPILLGYVRHEKYVRIRSLF